MEILTPALEDYIEAILVLGAKKGIVRVKEISRFLKVTTPSVVAALKILANKGLVRHERYGYVELTRKGKERATKVYDLHRALFKLLHEVLGINAEIAHQDACRIEHHVSEETGKKLKHFLTFLEECPEEKERLVLRFQAFGPLPEGGGDEMGFTLKDLGPGEKGKVIRIKGGAVKKKLLEMGIVPGTVIELERVAPLGDPVDVLVRGYHLSLRKEEAEEVLIERL